MKIKIFFILLILGVSIQAHAVQTFQQKVGVSRDMTKNSIIEELVLKALVSDSREVSGVYIFWDDVRDLKDKGVEKLNAKIRLEIRETNTDFLVLLMEKNEKKWNPIGGSVLIPQDDIVRQLDSVVVRLQQSIKKLYPPREKTQMDEIVVTTRTLSQFESPVPIWRFGVNLDYINYNTEYNFRYDITNTADSRYGRLRDTYGFLNISPVAEYNYRNTFMKFMLYGDTGLDHLMARAIWSKGILGSVVILGVEFLGTYYSSELRVPDTFNESTTNTIPLLLPTVQNWFITPAIHIGFNFTRQFSLKYSMGTVSVGDMSAYYPSSAMFPGGITVSSPVILESDGPAFYSFVFDFKLNSRLSMSLNYFYLGTKMKGGDSDRPNPIVHETQSTNWIEMEDISISYTYFGLGVRYEF